MTEPRKTKSPGPIRLLIEVEGEGDEEALMNEARRLAERHAEQLGGRVEVPAEDADAGADFIVWDQDGNIVFLIDAKRTSDRLERVRRELDTVRERTDEARERISRLRERVTD